MVKHCPGTEDCPEELKDVPINCWDMSLHWMNKNFFNFARIISRGPPSPLVSPTDNLCHISLAASRWDPVIIQRGGRVGVTPPFGTHGCLASRGGLPSMLALPPFSLVAPTHGLSASCHDYFPILIELWHTCSFAHHWHSHPEGWATVGVRRGLPQWASLVKIVSSFQGRNKIVGDMPPRYSHS